MILTRKIQLIINESDKSIKNHHYQTLRDWSRLVRIGANTVMSHKFAQQNIRDFVYLKDDIKEKFYIKHCLKEGEGMSEQNTTYRVLSDLMKGKVPSEIYSCLNSVLAQTYQKRATDMRKGVMSLPSYKNDIPMPFSKQKLCAMTVTEEGKGKSKYRYNFDFFGVPMQLYFGKDKSNNKGIIDKCLSGVMDWKFAQSSVVIDGKELFLNLCINFPKVTSDKLQEDKICSAMLSITTPIVANIEGKKKIYEIGSKEEFIAIREHIQGALHRIRKASRFSGGGKGRERKMQATERFKEKEHKYCQTMMHAYSQRLIRYCLNNGCGTLKLVAIEQDGNDFVEITQEEKSNIIKADPYLLRNWTYHGLLDKIKYKCELNGIKLIYK